MHNSISWTDFRKDLNYKFGLTYSKIHGNQTALTEKRDQALYISLFYQIIANTSIEIDSYSFGRAGPGRGAELHKGVHKGVVGQGILVAVRDSADA